MRDEATAVATANGYAPRKPFIERTETMLTDKASRMTASMYRDILAGSAIEADQIIGDLVARADAAKVAVPRLRMIYTHLKTYENQRGA